MMRVYCKFTGLCLLLCPLLLVVLTAAGASPLATQTAQAGPYKLLLSFYSLPRAGQALNMTIQTTNAAPPAKFSQAFLKPGPKTDANTVGVQINPSEDTKGVYDVAVTPPIRGAWLLHVTIQGSAGQVVDEIPITVEGPPEIPTWLGWLIGLLPLPLLMGFIWLQVGWRKAQAGQVQIEMQQRPSL